MNTIASTFLNLMTGLEICSVKLQIIDLDSGSTVFDGKAIDARRNGWGACPMNNFRAIAVQPDQIQLYQ